MISKDSLDNLLRALDGVEVQLEAELLELLRMGNKVSRTVPEIPPLDPIVRDRIWQESTSLAFQGKPREKRRAFRIRLACGLAAALALILTALLAIVLTNPWKPVVETGDEIATLQLSQGEIKVLSSGREERQAGDGEILCNGDSITASAETRGIVQYESGSIMRLEGEAEAVLSVDGGEINTEVIRGKSYHRVVDGTPYVVTSDGIRVVANGTAFTFDIQKDEEKIVSLESSLHVEILAGSKSGWKSDIDEGKAFLYQKGGEEPHMTEVSQADLNNEWLRWNKNLDKDLGLPLGVLSTVDEEGMAQGQGQGGPQPQAPPSPDNQAAPGGNKPVEDEPPPSSQPPPPPEPVEKTLALSAQTADAKVSFTWTLTGYAGFQGFKLVRSEINPAPSYPDDWWKYVDGANTRSTIDTSVQPGHTYYYRLGVYDQGMILGYSNVVQITVAGQPEELTIALTGSPLGGRVNLSWSVSGTATYDGFKVCRSETNVTPSYPGEWIAYVTGSTNYTDSDVLSGHTYYYRIGIYRNGSIIKYSNAIIVTMP